MSNYKIMQPMKYYATKKPEEISNALESDNYLLQLKKDGASYTLAKDSDGSVHLYGDKISKKTGVIIDKIDNVPHIKEWAERTFPKESQILIEICYGETSKDVNSIMLALPAKATQRQKDTQWAKAYIFDILFWGGEEVHKKDYIDRWEQVTNLYNTLEWDKNYLFVELATTVLGEEKAEKLQEWLDKGEEGGVLKLCRSTNKVSAAHALREIGATPARTAHLTYKVKQQDSADVVITGVVHPTKGYTGKDPDSHPYRDEDGTPINRLYALGMINAFSIAAYDEKGNLIHIGTVASGLNDEIRLDAAAQPEKYIGEVLEVHCMSKDNKSKTLRHPKMVQLRPDKNAQDCTLKHIFG